MWLGRAHALLGTFLSSQLSSALGSAHSRTDFLSSLSSGQLLCMAYNTCVRKSKKPWGYVSKDSIHDIISLEKAQSETESSEGAGKKGWTFRRTDNLRLWAGYVFRWCLFSVLSDSMGLQGTEASVLASDTNAKSTAQPDVAEFAQTHWAYSICFQSGINKSHWHAWTRHIAAQNTTGVFNGAGHRV